MVLYGNKGDLKPILFLTIKSALLSFKAHPILAMHF